LIRTKQAANGGTMTAQPIEDPTRSQFEAYGAAYDHFNRELFGGELPRCMLNFSRWSRRVVGFFAPGRWERPGERTHEISLNPESLYRPVEDTMSTLVHEMCHLWQQEFGRPSRTGYHNAEWAAKMEAVGLKPSHTGRPGGQRTGQQMTHYVIDGGPFQGAFASMPREYLLPWQSGGVRTARCYDKAKARYLCPDCGARVWGKPGLSISCGVCRVYFLPY
jgi:hypothetical protein